MMGLAILGSLLGGILLAVVGMFCLKLLQGMNKIQAAADQVIKDSKEIVAHAEKLLGESSPLSRGAKAITVLTGNLPEVMAGLKVFNETFSAIAKATFTQDTFTGNQKPTSVPPDDSAFIPYSEESAAQYEVNRRAQSERLVLSPEELAMMRTDKPAPETPTVES